MKGLSQKRAARFKYAIYNLEVSFHVDTVLHVSPRIVAKNCNVQDKLYDRPITEWSQNQVVH